MNTQSSKKNGKKKESPADRGDEKKSQAEHAQLSTTSVQRCLSIAELEKLLTGRRKLTEEEKVNALGEINIILAGPLNHPEASEALIRLANSGAYLCFGGMWQDFFERVLHWPGDAGLHILDLYYAGRWSEVVAPQTGAHVESFQTGAREDGPTSQDFIAIAEKTAPLLVRAFECNGTEAGAKDRDAQAGAVDATPTAHAKGIPNSDANRESSGNGDAVNNQDSHPATTECSNQSPSPAVPTSASPANNLGETAGNEPGNPPGFNAAHAIPDEALEVVHLGAGQNQGNTEKTIDLLDEPFKDEPLPNSERTPLNDQEAAVLQQCKHTIKNGFKTFVEVGWAFSVIIRQRLYRQTHKRFADFCEEVLEMSYRRAYQLRDSAEFIERIKRVNDCSQNGPHASKLPLPKNENQVRALTGLPPEEQLAVWKEANQKVSGENITGKILKSIVRARKKKATTQNHQQEQQETTKCAAFDPAAELKKVIEWLNRNRERWPSETRRVLNEGILDWLRK